MYYLLPITTTTIRSPPTTLQKVKEESAPTEIFKEKLGELKHSLHHTGNLGLLSELFIFGGSIISSKTVLHWGFGLFGALSTSKAK